MGVYIKDMDKPSECDLCNFEDYGYCRALLSYINVEEGIDTRCPLVEVKVPHGRLVDESEIHTGIRREKNTEYRYFIDKVNAPTVIEAEVE